MNVERFDVLDLIACANSYGHNNQVLMSTFAGWLGEVTDDEIKSYCDKVLQNPAYGEEDRESFIEAFSEFKLRYLP